jgi:hypothetical protein
VVEVTLVMVGARVSITMALLPPRELAEAVVGRVKKASKAVNSFFNCAAVEGEGGGGEVF